MRTDDIDVLQQLETRICELQRVKITLQDELKDSRYQAERATDEFALRIIDVLDMIEATRVSSSEADSQVIIRKIEKRLIEALKRMEVVEITFTDNRIEPGKVRVLETRMVPGSGSGTILEICRKGYQRGDRVIRVVDVVGSL